MDPASVKRSSTSIQNNILAIFLAVQNHMLCSTLGKTLQCCGLRPQWTKVLKLFVPHQRPLRVQQETCDVKQRVVNFWYSFLSAYHQQFVTVQLRQSNYNSTNVEATKFKRIFSKADTDLIFTRAVKIRKKTFFGIFKAKNSYLTNKNKQQRLLTFVVPKEDY